MFNVELIKAMERLGFKRWTKGNCDRLYVKATSLGLDCEYYKTGNVSYAEWLGEKISNKQATRFLTATTYFDLNSGEIVGTNPELTEQAEKLIDKLTSEVESVKENAIKSK